MNAIQNSAGSPCNSSEFKELHDQNQNRHRPYADHCATGAFAPMLADAGPVFCTTNEHDGGGTQNSRTLRQSNSFMNLGFHSDRHDTDYSRGIRSLDYDQFQRDRRRDNETCDQISIELLVAAFGSRTAVWVRRRTRNFTSSFKSTFRPTFRPTSAGPEHFRQLAVQHDVHCGGALLDDCWQYQSIRQFGKWRSACGRFELL